jgi:pectinesterase
MHCYIGQHILPAGWSNWNNTDNDKTARYAEYENYGPGANPPARVKWARQLSGAEAKAMTQETVLNNWNPNRRK